MEISQGENPMSIFGEEFHDASYCYLIDETLILSFIAVKKEYRATGVFSRLLDDAKKVAKRVEIPMPSLIVLKKALLEGFKPTWQWNDRFGEKIEILVWESDGETSD